MAVAAYEPFHAPEGAIETPWTKDIRTGVAAMTTTGGHLWNAAERLVGTLILSDPTGTSQLLGVPAVPSEATLSLRL